MNLNLNLNRHFAAASVAAIALTGAATAVAATPHTSSAATAAVTAAKNQWISEGLVGGGALQNVSFEIVVADLRKAVKAGASTSSTNHAIAVVLDIGSLPDSMLTKSEEKEFQNDTAAVDKFFGIAKNPWGGGCLSHGPDARAAAKAWALEPSNAHHGVSATPLKTAAADLAKGVTGDAGDRSCYGAAIADLTGLETATSAQIADAASYDEKSFSNPSAGQVVDMEILWLNDFFGLVNGGTGSTDRLMSAT